MSKYPKIIYVQENEENDGEKYLNAYYEASETYDGKVAVYKLEKIVKKRTETIISKI